MPLLVDVVAEPPPFAVEQARAATFARLRFGRSVPHLERLMPIFANAGIVTRSLCRPPEWYERDHPLDERNAAYIEAATEMCASAARTLLARRGLGPSDIDRIVYVNTTGLATPSIDARLVNVLGLPRHVRRTPVWGLGCAGGVAGLSLAFHDLLGHPRERVLVFAAEMCTLTFLSDDHSTSNLVATALFSDGAAVALLAGDETGDEGYQLLETRSTLYPDSLEIMGWNVLARGLQVVFSQRIPTIIAEHAADDLDALLATRGLDRSSVQEFLYHPGGPKVLHSYAEAYGMSDERFHRSRQVLADHGNMSSVTVLYVLAHYMAEHRPGRPGFGVVSALGPGFSSESVLMKL